MGSEGYIIIPPILAVAVEDSMDIMIARDTARRAAGLLGFAPAFRAQLAGAAAALAELVLKTGVPHELSYSGVQNGNRTGIQISCAAPWLVRVVANNVVVALRAKMGDLVDDISLREEDPPVIVLTMWLTPLRKVQAVDFQDETDSSAED